MHEEEFTKPTNTVELPTVQPPASPASPTSPTSPASPASRRLLGPPGSRPPAGARPKALRFTNSLSRAASRVARREAGWVAYAGHDENPFDTRLDRRVIDLALRIAERMLASGASVNDVTRTIIGIVDAYDLRDVHVDVTYTAIHISQPRGFDLEPLTAMRIVRQRTSDYRELERLEALVARMESGSLTIDDARREYIAIARGGRAYRRWVVSVANVSISVGVLLFFSTSPTSVLLAAVAALLIDVSQRWLDRTDISGLFVQATGAFLAAATAMSAAWLGQRGVLDPTQVSASLIVTGGIVLLVAGMSLVGAATDALDGNYITASARTYEVLMQTLGIVIGVVAGVQLAEQVGVPFVLAATPNPAGPVGLQLVGAVLVAGGYSIACSASPRAIAWSALLGAGVWLVYRQALVGGLAAVVATALAAVVAGLVAQPLARRVQVPALALTSAAIVSLVPGLALYRAILRMMGPTPDSGNITYGIVGLIGALGLGVAIAIGVALGTLISRPAGRTVHRRQRPGTARQGRGLG